MFDNNHEIENDAPVGVKQIGESKEKARLLAFLGRTNTSADLEAKRAEFERHGLATELNDKLADLAEGAE